MIRRFNPGYAHLIGAFRSGPDHKRAEIRDMYGKALGYAWGRIDGGEVRMLFGHDSMDFATSYAWHVLESQRANTVTHNLMDAWSQWTAKGEIQ
jgi:hypothetical protein